MASQTPLQRRHLREYEFIHFAPFDHTNSASRAKIHCMSLYPPLSIFPTCQTSCRSMTALRPLLPSFFFPLIQTLESRRSETIGGCMLYGFTIYFLIALVTSVSISGQRDPDKKFRDSGILLRSKQKSKSERRLDKTYEALSSVRETHGVEGFLGECVTAWYHSLSLLKPGGSAFVWPYIKASQVS
jgi:hypothetical protein